MNLVFRVQGMSCEHCEAAVRRAVLRLDRSAQVRIDRPAERVEVDTTQASDAVAQAIRDEGYTVTS